MNASMADAQRSALAGYRPVTPQGSPERRKRLARFDPLG